MASLTKAELEKRVQDLRAQLTAVIAERDTALARLAEMGEVQAEIIAIPLARSCINCGTARTVYSVGLHKYGCSSCGHVWTDAEESAPFRAKRG